MTYLYRRQTPAKKARERTDVDTIGVPFISYDAGIHWGPDNTAEEDWEVGLVRFTADGSAVDGCDANSSISNRYHEINLFSLLCVPIGSLAFQPWQMIEDGEPALRSQIRALQKLLENQATRSSVAFPWQGERHDSVRMDSAPLFKAEPLLFPNTDNGCTWRSLSSAYSTRFAWTKQLRKTTFCSSAARAKSIVAEFGIFTR